MAKKIKEGIINITDRCDCCGIQFEMYEPNLKRYEMPYNGTWLCHACVMTFHHTCGSAKARYQEFKDLYRKSHPLDDEECEVKIQTAPISDSEIFMKELLVKCPAINRKGVDNILYEKGLEKLDFKQFKNLIQDREEKTLRPWKRGGKTRSSKKRLYVRQGYRNVKEIESALRDWQSEHDMWEIFKQV